MHVYCTIRKLNPNVKLKLKNYEILSCLKFSFHVHGIPYSN